MSIKRALWLAEVEYFIRVQMYGAIFIFALAMKLKRKRAITLQDKPHGGRPLLYLKQKY